MSESSTHTGGILFNPDLAVEEVFSRVELHFLILIFENQFSGHFTTQMANSLFNPDFKMLFSPDLVRSRNFRRDG